MRAVVWLAVGVSEGGRQLPIDEREARVFFLLSPGPGGRAGGRGQILALRAMALAYTERTDDAIVVGERANEIQPPGERVAGPYTRYLLARIYLLAGQSDKAMERIEAMLGVPDYITPSWIRIDPTLAGLKQSARYRRVIGTGR